MHLLWLQRTWEAITPPHLKGEMQCIWTNLQELHHSQPHCTDGSKRGKKRNNTSSAGTWWHLRRRLHDTRGPRAMLHWSNHARQQRNKSANQPTCSSLLVMARAFILFPVIWRMEIPHMRKQWIPGLIPPPPPPKGRGYVAT